MLPDAIHVATTLAALVAPMIGPHGRDVLLETDDQISALITGSGHVLLTNVLDVDAMENKGNAVARYLLQQLNEHNDRHGDGCTTVIIMVAAGLRRAASSSSIRNFYSSSARLLRLARTLQWLRSSWIEREYYHAMVTKWALPLPRGNVSSAVHALFVSSLAGQYGPKAVVALAKVSSEWILGATAEGPVASAAGMSGVADVTDAVERLDTIEERVDHILRGWPVVKASGGSLSSSQILNDEVLVERPFFREQSWAEHHFHPKYPAARIAFVVVVGSFDPSASSQLMSAPRAETFVGDSRANDVVTCRSNWSSRCVDAMADAGVRLLLCTEALPEEFAGHLRRRGVLAVDHVERAQAVLLCRRAGIAPISVGAPSSFRYGKGDRKGDRKGEMGRATAVGRVTLGGINCVYVRGLVVETGSAVPGQLLLQGSSDGLLRQYERSVRRMLIVVKRWLGERRTDEEKKKVGGRGVSSGRSSSGRSSSGSDDHSGDDGALRVVLGGGRTEIAGQVWCHHLSDLFLSGCPLPSHSFSSSSSTATATAAAKTGRPTDAEISVGFAVLASMFGSVPRALAHRERRGGSSEYMEEVARMTARVSSTCLSYDDDDASGNVVETLCARPARLDLVAAQPIETPAGRLANVCKAVDIVSTLLRVDDVLRVKSGRTSNRSSLEGSMRRLGRRQFVPSSHCVESHNDSANDEEEEEDV
jgi:hypothetical protein